MLLVLAVKVGSLPTHCANGKFVLRTGFEPMSPAVCLIYTTYLCRCLNHLTNETYGGGQGTRTLKPLARLGSFQDCCLTIRLTLHRCFPPYRCRKTYTNKICYGNLYSALSFISAVLPDDTLPNTWFHSYAISELISDVLIGGDGAGDETRTRTVSPPRDFLTTLTYDFVSQRCCCSLEYVFAISFDLGSGYILSTHLSQTKSFALFLALKPLDSLCCEFSTAFPLTLSPF